MSITTKSVNIDGQHFAAHEVCAWPCFSEQTETGIWLILEDEEVFFPYEANSVAQSVD